MKSVRMERINSEIQKEISYIINNKLRDPQLNSIISVSSVEVTPDLAEAKVFITSFGSMSTSEVVARIKGAGSFIRGELTKRIKLRITPRLNFYEDESTEYANKIDDILKTITYSTKADEPNEEE
ncbi:MAG: 30S ribosome-binding factor RbfA [Clostridia bacterium]|nr:30S ribosome-binding factor RbfA [Clostridia bacterium]